VSADEGPDRAAATYDAAADCYDAAASACWDRFGLRTVERVALRTGDHVLDACCGAGSSVLPAAERVGPTGHVLGIDVAERLLARAKTKALARGLVNVELRLGDIQKLDGITRPFDAVICVFGVFFCTDMAAVASRLWSLVRPGGVLAITTWGPRLFEPASSAFWGAVQREDATSQDEYRPWDRLAEPAALRALFDEAGIPFAEVTLEPGNHRLHDPEDWWTIVRGSGYRATLERLSPKARERVRAATLERLAREGVSAIETNVLYGTARRAVDR
jgi:ubiquinone/menaquinone biosynthesis C-methylase UbiE